MSLVSSIITPFLAPHVIATGLIFGGLYLKREIDLNDIDASVHRGDMRRHINVLQRRIEILEEKNK